MHQAVEYTYNLCPIYIKVLLPQSLVEEFLTNFIQKIFDEIKEALDYHLDEINELKATIVKLKEGEK